MYDLDADLLLDTRAMSLPTAGLNRSPHIEPAGAGNPLERFWVALKHRFAAPDATVSDDRPLSGAKVFPEVTTALGGGSQSIVRINPRGETIISVAVPIMRSHSVRGALLLSTQGGDIDLLIASERWAMVRVFLVAASVTFLLSLFPRRHDRGADAPPCRGGREGAPGRELQAGNSRFHEPFRRDRPFVRCFAGYDPCALHPHGGDRELCRRCGARVEEPADLPAECCGNAAPHQKTTSPARGCSPLSTTMSVASIG